MQETDSQSQEQATATKAASAPAKSRTLWGDAFKRLRKNKLAVIGVCWIIIVVVVALTADLWAKPWLGSPTASDSTTMAETALMAPCAEHPFGTDAAILTVKENDYVDAARAMGASDARIVVRHIFPNSVASIVVYATMNIGGAILTESALSYLGMGVIPPTPSWGSMIQDGQQYMMTAPWMMVMPGLAILSTVLAFTLLGDGLRDALDVKMKDA